MRALLSIILTLWLASLSSQPAFAEKRVALVIGNSVYQKVAKLSNPANDADAVATMFKAAGFDSVELKLNVLANDLRKSLREFGNKSRDADVAVVYYAGHGIELDGTNYLIPVDANLETDADVLDETIPLDRVLFAVEPAKQLRLIILDACRDNPFAKNMKRTIASRSIGRGLAKIEPTSPNTMIAFAAKAGSTASDGDSKNSPFATAIVEHLPKPGLDLRRAFGFVRDDVLKSTGNKQEPYVYGSLGGDDVPLVPARPVAAGPQPDPQAPIRRDYELALQAGDRDGWEAFLRAHPDGYYADLARVQLKKIAAEEVRAAAAEKARVAEQEKARLATEGARQAEQAKAAATAKAAEDAKIAAERAQQVQQEKVTAAEQARAAAEKLAADKIAAQKAAADKLAAERAEAATAKAAAVQTPEAVETTADAAKLGQQVVSLPSTDSSAPSDALTVTDIARLMQLELRRVGCLSGAADGEWAASSRRALEFFNRNAGTKFDVGVVSLDTLDVIKTKPARICPLICERGFKVDGERCTKVACRAGYELGDDNTCEKIQAKEPKQEELKVRRARPEMTKTASKPVRPQSTETPQARFANSPTCTNVRLACEQAQSKHGTVDGHCPTSFAECMQTGKWRSNYSNYEGLARR